jgi:hypothetical protein
MKLTASTVRSAELPAGKSEVIFWDDDISGFRCVRRDRGHLFSSTSSGVRSTA